MRSGRPAINSPTLMSSRLAASLALDTQIRGDMVIGDSLSSVRRTPRSINSGGYFLVPDMPKAHLSRGRIHGTQRPEHAHT
jgi:hypothetical protein